MAPTAAIDARQPAEASVAMAEAAGLHYVHDTDTDPGLSRRRAGTGWSYRRPDGTIERDPATIARIRGIVIPPAWSDVWICTRDDGHLQATGWDARRRKQYRYHPDWRAVRDEAKFERVLDFGLSLPALRRRVSADLTARGLPRHKVTAAVIDLMDQTLIRVGNEEYARTNESYGLTTLRDEHADIKGGTVTFCFRGKGGHHRELALSDRRLARVVKRCQDVPGQVLFQYIDGDEQLCAVEPAASETEAKRQAVAAIKAAAELLANTPTVCRSSYVHPTVVDAHHAGQLCAVAARDIRRVLAAHPGLGHDEAKLVVILRRAARQATAADGEAAEAS